jgi:hypothetical protein
VAVERKEQRWCPRDEERFFFFSVQRPQSLFLYIFLPLTSPSLLLFLDDDGAVGGDWEERWRRWWLWGGAGGSYADSNRWFLLLSLLLCFHFQDLAMALVVVLLLFLSV